MARKAANIRKRADGSFEKRITIDGKRISIYGATAKECNEKELELRQQIASGTYTSNRNITLDAYFEEWLQNKRSSAKPNTLKTYKAYYNKHISPVLGKRKVQQLERREIIQMQSALTKNLSISSCNMILKILTIILNDAVHDDIIVKNPASSVKSLKNTAAKASETYHRALTESEQEIFMKEIKNDYYYSFIALMLCTGMRYGEVGALQWRDIDYKNKCIHISKTLTYTESGNLVIGDTPKSEASRRDIPLTDNIADILSRHRTFMWGNVIPQKDNLVFMSVYGTYVHNHAINRTITNTIARLEKKGIHIDHFTAHCFRDTFATRFVESGGSLQTLKTILGHNSLSMTADLYAHVLPNTKQEEMSKMNIVI